MPKTGCDDSLAFLEVIPIRETRDHGVRLIRDRTRVRRSRAADADLELAHAGAAAKVRAPAVLSGLRLAFASKQTSGTSGPARCEGRPRPRGRDGACCTRRARLGASTRTR